jgi:hypothetical protein
MQFVALLAPVAFVFALAALAQVGSLKKKLEELQKEIEALKQEKQSVK